MRVHVAPRIVGRKDAIAVLEVEFTSRARRVRVRGSDRLEPLDLNGDRAGGLYDVPDALPRVHVPLRVLREGPGKTHLVVTVEDATGALAPESWEGDVVLDAPPVKAENRRTALLLTVFSLVVGAIVWFVGIPLLRARNPKVPALAGLARVDAERRLKERGIAPVVQFVDANSAGEIGKVLAQSPGPDVVVDRDSTVTISVARGVAETGALVPALVGRTEAEAASALVGTGFRLDTVDAESSEDLAGKVIRQTPAGGARAPAGARIEIVVGRAKVPVVPPVTTEPPPVAPTAPTAPTASSVPALVGKTRAEAEQALLAAGLVPLVEVLERADASEGAVLSQDPAGGASLPVGSTVTLRVAKRPAPVAPNPVVETSPPAIPPAIPVAPPVVVEPPKPPAVPPVPPAPPVVVESPTLPAVPPVPPAPPVVVEPPTLPAVPPVPPAPPVAVEPPTLPAVPPVPPAPPVVVEPPTLPAVPPVPPAPPVAPAVPAAPDVLGMNQADAEKAIRAAGLEPRLTPEEVEAGDPEGLVLRQVPLAGDPSNAGTVEIFVSRRATPVAVPLPPVSPPVAPAVPPAPPSVPTIPPAPPVVPPVPPEPPVVTPPTPVVAPPTPMPPVASNLPPPASRTGTLTSPPTAPPLPSAPIAPPPSPVPVVPYVPAPPNVVAPPVVVRPAAPVATATLGSEMLVVPDFTGRDAGDAIASAIASGFVPTVVADRDARAAAGRVRVQSLAPGTAMRAGSPVTLSVGGGYAPTMIDVPNVVGLTTADAVATLARYGIAAQVVSVRGRPGVFVANSQLVVAQTPAGRVTPALASYVRLYLVIP